MEMDATQPLKSYALVLLEKIRENAPISKRELQNITGFSWGLISRLTNELVDASYIVSKGKVDTGVGRKPDEFDVNSEKNYFIGVDFSHRGTIIAVTDMKGCIIESCELTWLERKKDIVLTQFFETLDCLMEKYADKNIMGIGFAVQGVVNVEKGISVYIGGIEGWNDIPFKTLVEDRYDVDAVVAHDPDCLMQCEQAFGVLKDGSATDVVLLHFVQGVSIGMSVMLNGKIYLGHHAKAGEVGHMILGKMTDGRYDFMDNHVNKVCIERDYQRLAPSAKCLTYQEIVAQAKEGDDLCKQVFQQICDYIAQSVAVVNSLLNPEVIVVNTVGCDYQELLMNTVEEHLRTVSYDKTVKLQLSKLGGEAKAVGAALIAIDSVMSEIL